MTMTTDRVTICGNIGTDPVRRTTAGGDAVVNFRVGSSSGYRDRKSGAWVDTGTSWYDVSAFRDLADHAKASLRLGDPVIVTGSFRLREWDSNGKKGVSADITADAIGHDLNRGTSAFARRSRSPQAAGGEQGAQAAPAASDDGGASDAEHWNVAGLHPVDVDAAGREEEEARSFA